MVVRRVISRVYGPRLSHCENMRLHFTAVLDVVLYIDTHKNV
jgi:hypothetical protein